MPTVLISPENRSTTADPAELGHVLSRLAGTAVRQAPFLHAYTTDLLSPGLYAAFRAAFPTPEAGMRTIKERSGDANYPVERFSQVLPTPGTPEAADLPPPIQSVLNVLSSDQLVQALLKKFAAVVGPRLAAYEEKSGKSTFMVGTGLDLTYDRSGFQLVPHTDAARKLITGLLYLADPEDPVELGTVLYEPIDKDFATARSVNVSRDKLRPFARAPYKANGFLSFARSDQSFHGVEASDSGRPRRLLQYSINIV